MRVRTSHFFEAPLAATLSSLESPAYAAALAAHHPFFEEITPIALSRQGTRVVRSVRYRARPFLPPLGRFTPAPAWFTWIEHSTLDLARAELQFENVPELGPVRERFLCGGRMCFRARQGETGSGTLRLAEFDIAFAVPRVYRPLAAVALSLVAQKLESALDDEARLLREWLSREGQPAARSA